MDETSNNRDHAPQSLYHWLFVPHIISVVLHSHPVSKNFHMTFRCQKRPFYCPQMSGLSYFAIQIQSCLKKLNPSPTTAQIVFKCKVQVQMKSKLLENSAFSQQKFLISVSLTESKSGPVSSEISDLCEISYLLLFFIYFPSQNK